MASEWHQADAPFFSDKARAGSGESRNPERTRALARMLGLHLDRDIGNSIPNILVVGSKGKGTIATSASAVLASAGRLVVTVVSPSFREHRHRIVIDGAPVDSETYDRLSESIRAVLESAWSNDLPPGYASPVGLFMLAGALLARERSADAFVVEAGLGGRSDDISLFRPSSVAVGAIIEEHLDRLGGSIDAIAADKLAVVQPSVTNTLVSAPQREEVEQNLERLGCPVKTIDSRSYQTYFKQDRPKTIVASANVGTEVALLTLAEVGVPLPNRSQLEKCLTSLDLPGRGSVHHTPRGTLVIDSAINRSGAKELVDWVGETFAIDRVLYSIPDGKDRKGVEVELRRLGVPTVHITLDEWHLSYASAPHGSVALDDIEVGGFEGGTLAVGTVSFVARMLKEVDSDDGTLYRLCKAAEGTPHSDHD